MYHKDMLRLHHKTNLLLPQREVLLIAVMTMVRITTRLGADCTVR